MIKNISIFPILLVLLFSCATQAEESQNVTLQQENLNAGEPKIETSESMENLPSWIFDSSPKNGHPRIVVFTTRRADREEEIVKAAQQAAIESARNRAVYVSAKELSQKGNANFGYVNDLYMNFNKDLALDLLDDMEVENQVETPQGTFARFIDNSSNCAINFIVANPSNPTWVSQVPDIPGYLLTTGFVESHRNWAESFKAADESAITQLAYTFFGQIDNQVETRDQASTTRARTSTLATILIQGEGLLENLVILGRWQDDSGNFYSLVGVPHIQ
ncbi:MAG: hypothetical protein PF447_12635 [Spirochaetaceae bacterium]|jgi:hypothetical protein|nr:hypothetical protein [Spirochaetaceae bacterium]